MKEEELAPLLCILVLCVLGIAVPLVERIREGTYQVVRPVVFDFCVDIHRDPAVFMPREILYGLRIHTGCNQVRDISVPQLMRRHLKVEAVCHMAIVVITLI